MVWCPHSSARCLPGAGLWRAAWQSPASPASLPLYLEDGGFQVAQADAELQPPQEMVGGGGQDVKLLVHEAVQGGSLRQVAPGRQGG